MNVADVMTREVAAVTPDTPLKEVAALLVHRRISGAPVCAPDARPVGVVSEQDVLYKEACPEGGPRRPRLRRRGPDVRAKAEALTAADAMTAPALTIGPGRTVTAAARLMVDRNVHRLPVVDRDGVLVGIVTRGDLVRAFARADEEIAREIEEDVLERLLWLPPGRVSVGVAQGQVELDGTVERRSEAELAATLARRVPGVVGVRARIGWSEDNLPRGRRLGRRRSKRGAALQR